VFRQGAAAMTEKRRHGHEGKTAGNDPQFSEHGEKKISRDIGKIKLIGIFAPPFQREKGL